MPTYEVYDSSNPKKAIHTVDADDYVVENGIAKFYERGEPGERGDFIKSIKLKPGRKVRVRST
jgi:hypothetical protein